MSTVESLNVSRYHYPTTYVNQITKRLVSPPCGHL